MSRITKFFYRITLMMTATALLSTPAWCAAGSKVLYSFAGGTDGANPYSSLIFDSAGNLYGTTEKGGTYGGGTAFKLSQSNGIWTETVLSNFGATSTDAYTPMSSLVFDQAGNLYGTTWAGGANYAGTVYELSPAGGRVWTRTILHSFSTTNGDGFNPNSGVFLTASGKIYGTTQWGGAAPTCNAWNFGCGTFFELAHTPNGWKESVLYSFYAAPDSSQPWGNLAMDKAGNFYDTAIWGGSDSYAGTVFEMSPTGSGTWTENIIYTLNPNTGAGLSNELGGVVFDASGNIYGASGGGVYELTPSSSGWTETTLYQFPGGSGPSNPYSGVSIFHSSVLWGTTAWGGGGTCSTNGCGTLYRVQKIGGVWQQNAIFHFRDASKGWFPTASPIFDSAGNVYGTTMNGGAYGYGVVYEVTP